MRTSSLALLRCLLVVYGASACSSSSHDKAITSFAFLAANNPSLISDATATIHGASIDAVVPVGSDRGGLIATFESGGAAVDVAGVPQRSGVTTNDFTVPVTYTVTAADGTRARYLVTAAFPEDALTEFSFRATDNPQLTDDVVATIVDTTITAELPHIDASSLIATYTTTGRRVTVAGAAQASGATVNDFTSPVTYTVSGQDGSMQDYVVHAVVAVDPAKAFTSFAFPLANNPGLGRDVIATISGTTITATAPYGTSVGALKARWVTTGTAVTVAGRPQVNGVTTNDFTNPVLYTISAADGSTQTYSVDVGVALSPAKDISAFSFRAADNPGLPADVAGAISGQSISITLPFMEFGSLVATFSTTGSSVAIGGVAQVSGATTNDFAEPVRYVVSAADGTTRTYTVTVNARAFSFSACTFPNALAIGDFNSDGKPDVAMTCTGPFNPVVGVMLDTTATGAVTPTFSADVDFALGQGSPASAIAVGDFNGDGKPDIAATNESDNKVYVLLDTTATNAATPTFASAVGFAVGSEPLGIAVADFNGDGKPDLAVANYNGSNSPSEVSILLNTTATGASTSTFAAAQAIAVADFGPWGIVVGDLNGDGEPDIAVADYASSRLSIVFDTTANGSSTASFSSHADFALSGSPQAVGIADLNADGKPDIIVPIHSGSTASVYVNMTGSGASSPNLTEATLACGPAPSWVTSADFDGDGKPDLAFPSSYQATTVSLLRNRTNAGSATLAFAPPVELAVSGTPTVAVAADVNGDGKPDIVVIDGSSSPLNIFLNH